MPLLSCCWWLHLFQLLLLLLLLPALWAQAAQYRSESGPDYDAKAISTESLKESIKALYMNMDVPEVGPTDGAGALNVSVRISEVERLDNHELDLSFNLHLRWGHRFLDMLPDTLEAIPLSREKLWTPKFVFLNVRSVREEQSSLYLKLSGGGRAAKSIVYRIWHRASIRCDGPAMQYPFGDTMCTVIFEEANPHSQRSVHMALSAHHQHNCSAYETGRHSIVYRLSKPFASDGRKYQFVTQLCIKSGLEEMSPALRQYCLSLILVLYSFTTLYFFNRTARLLINLALLHILLFNWLPVGPGGRLNAIDIWLAKCTLAICCCLLAAMATAATGGAAGAGDSNRRRRERQREEAFGGRQSVKCHGGSYSGTFLMQSKDPQTSSTGVRTSKCTTISECSDHLDLFPADPPPPPPPMTPQQHHRSSQSALSSGAAWQLTLAKSALPACWLLLATTFWACLLLTSAKCPALLPECFQRL